MVLDHGVLDVSERSVPTPRRTTSRSCQSCPSPRSPSRSCPTRTTRTTRTPPELATVQLLQLKSVEALASETIQPYPRSGLHRPLFCSLHTANSGCAELEPVKKSTKTNPTAVEAIIILVIMQVPKQKQNNRIHSSSLCGSLELHTYSFGLILFLIKIH